MRRKRLLCVCVVLALLLAVPARAGDISTPGETPPAAGETVPETPEIPDGSPDGSEPPETPTDPEDPEPENPENPDPENPADPENPENPEDPENPEGEGPEDEEPSKDEEPEDEEPEEEEPEDEEPEEEEPEDEPAAAIEEPVIYVEVPDTGRVVVNPYGLEVNMDGAVSYDQVVSAPMTIVSYSSVPLAVLASAAGQPAPGSEAVLVSAPPNGSSARKELFMFAEFQSAYDAYGGADWSGVYAGAYNQVPVMARGAEPREVLRLAASDGMTPACGAFRLFGSASIPTAGIWRTQDTVQVTLTFTFKPLDWAEALP